MQQDVARRVVRSLVRVWSGDDGGWGTGFRIGDSRIVTAAHCLPEIPYPPGEDWTVVTIGTFPGHDATTDALVSFVDPVADVAVLDKEGAGGDLPNMGEALESFLRPLARLLVPRRLPGTPRPVYVHTIDRRWVEGVLGAGHPLAAKTMLEFNGDILPGTSGSPVVDDRGRAIGIVSQSCRTGNGPSNKGVVPLLATSLPPRVYPLSPAAWRAARRRLTLVPDASPPDSTRSC